MDDELEHIVSCDSEGNILEGGKKYKIHLPSNVPASDFWSIIVYDSGKQSIIQTDQPWPSVFSSNKNLFYNDDGSVDVWFGSEPVEEKEGNWIKTIPGKSWYLILRLYYPLASWYEKSWRPGEVEEIIK